MKSSSRATACGHNGVRVQEQEILRRIGRRIADRNMMLLPPVKPRFGLIAVSVHHVPQPLSSIALIRRRRDRYPFRSTLPRGRKNASNLISQRVQAVDGKVCNAITDDYNQKPHGVAVFLVCADLPHLNNS